MMKNSYSFPAICVLITAIVLLSASCKKSSSSPQSTITDSGGIFAELESYSHVGGIKADGTFIFESDFANNDSTLINTVSAGGNYFSSQAGTVTAGGGPLMIGTHQFLIDSAGNYGFDTTLSQKGLYGVNVSFTLTPPPSQIAAGASDSTVITSIYSPKTIYITNIAPMVNVTAVNNTPMPITWNADPANPNGVVIFGQYLPTQYQNQTAFNNGYTTVVGKAIHVADNGSTVIPWNFFSQFPPGSNITLSIGRGNFTAATNGAYHYIVGGFSSSSIWEVAIP